MIASDLVRELFDYHDGHLYWRKKTNRSHVISRPAGTINVTGYRVVTCEGVR